MTGTVNAALEAVLPLTVSGPSGQSADLEAVIDTGFTAFLTLPPSIVAALGLPWVSTQQVLLADGNVHAFDVFQATVFWDGQPRTVEVEAVDVQPLLGMRMLYRSAFHMDVVNGGAVTINALP
jgi:clan AA aspartic protease